MTLGGRGPGRARPRRGAARPRQRRSRVGVPLLFGATALLCLGGCERGPRIEPIPERDLSLLELMLVINPPYYGIQPQLRNPAAMDDVAAAAQTIVDACESETFATWTERPDFDRDPATWHASYADLLEGARTARDAARAGDLETLHDAYSRISRSCTACHKRYSPHQ